MDLRKVGEDSMFPRFGLVWIFDPYLMWIFGWTFYPHLMWISSWISYPYPIWIFDPYLVWIFGFLAKLGSAEMVALPSQFLWTMPWPKIYQTLSTGEAFHIYLSWGIITFHCFVWHTVFSHFQFASFEFKCISLCRSLANFCYSFEI